MKYYWIDLSTGEESGRGYATKGLVIQAIRQRQSQTGHPFRYVLRS